MRTMLIVQEVGGCLTKKNPCSGRLFECRGRLFLLTLFSFFAIFCYFFIVCNFCKLLFTVEGGKVCCFNLFFDCSGGGGAPTHMPITNFFYC